jgi:hypothetical protein
VGLALLPAALKVVAPLLVTPGGRGEDDLLGKSLYAQVSLAHHVGISYMMLRRYDTGCRTFLVDDGLMRSCAVPGSLMSGTRTPSGRSPRASTRTWTATPSSPGSRTPRRPPPSPRAPRGSSTGWVGTGSDSTGRCMCRAVGGMGVGVGMAGDQGGGEAGGGPDRRGAHLPRADASRPGTHCVESSILCIVARKDQSWALLSAVLQVSKMIWGEPKTNERGDTKYQEKWRKVNQATDIEKKEGVDEEERVRRVVDQIMDVFASSAPKFVNPASASPEASREGGRDSHATFQVSLEILKTSVRGSGSTICLRWAFGNVQKSIFREHVKQMVELRKLQGYLKLYSTIGLDKVREDLAGVRRYFVCQCMRVV